MKHSRLAVALLSLALSSAACKKSEPAAGSGKPAAAGSAAAPTTPGGAAAGSAAAGTPGGAAAGSDTGAPTTPAKGGTTGEPGATTPTAGAEATVLKIGPAVDVPADGLKITAAPIKVGDTRTIDDTMEMNGTLDAGGRQGPLVARKRVEAREEITAVDGNKLAALKVTYQKYVDTNEVMGKMQPSTSLTGTYELKLDGGKVAAVKDGQAVGPDELKELTQAYDDDLGKEPRMQAVLAKRAFKMGERIDLTPEELASITGGDNDIKHAKVGLTLIAWDGSSALFELDGIMAGTSGPMELEFSLKGQVQVDAKTGRAHKLALSGEVSGRGQGVKFGGKMVGTKSWTY